MQNIDWSPLVNAVIALVGVVLTAYIIPWIKASIGEKELANVRLAVNTAVKAAEMLFSSKEGEAKKQWVIDYLAAINIVIDEEMLSALIEEAVYEMNKNEDKPAKTVTVKTEEVIVEAVHEIKQ